MTKDLQAALEADPDNPEAKALLHQRSVTVEKVGYLPINRPWQFSFLKFFFVVVIAATHQ